MAGSRQSRADDGYGWVAPKPCGRWLWLGRAKAVRTMAMAGSRQRRADDDYGWVAPISHQRCAAYRTIGTERGLRPAGLRIRLRVCLVITDRQRCSDPQTETSYGPKRTFVHTYVGGERQIYHEKWDQRRNVR